MSIPTDPTGTTGARRVDLLPVENLTPEQRALYDAIRSGPRAKIAISGASKPGPLGGPFNVWLRSPGIGDCVQRLGEEIRFRSTLPSKLNEMAIMVTARLWTSHYEWFAHKRLALKGGMDPQIIEDIRQRRTPVFDDPKGKMIYDLAKSLHEGHGVAKGLYDDAVKLLGERGVVEVIGLCGYYTLVSMTLNTFEFGLPEGEVSDLA